MLRMDARMDIHTDNVKTAYPPQTKFAGGIKKDFKYISKEFSISISKYNNIGS